MCATNVHTEMTLWELKLLVAAHAEWSPELLKLVWNGQVLQPNHSELGVFFGSERKGLQLCLVKMNQRKVFFEGVAWPKRVTCGISAKKAREGSQLSNASEKDLFLEQPKNGGLAFESVSQPGLYIGVQGTRIILCQPNGSQEIFRLVGAMNKAPGPCLSLQSVAQAGSFLCHCNGMLYCHNSCNAMQSNKTVFNDDATWRILDAED